MLFEVLSSSKQTSACSKIDEINIRKDVDDDEIKVRKSSDHLFSRTNIRKEKLNGLVASSSSLVKKLPQAILLEVMTFLYDDLPSMQSMLCSSKDLLIEFSHRDVMINHAQ